MMWPFRKRVRGNARTVRAIYTVPDRWGVQAASLGIMTHTFSPGSAGIHHPSTQPRGFTGLPGYGVNRWAGEEVLPVQNFRGPVAPIVTPSNRRVGLGAGVTGQPGMPSTGQDNNPGLASLAWMSYNPLGRAGMGG